MLSDPSHGVVWSMGRGEIVQQMDIAKVWDWERERVGFATYLLSL